MNEHPSESGVLRRQGQAALAFRRVAGHGPTVVWLGGLRSDMTGTKAAALDALAQREGFGFLRFDYSGHGASDGHFEDGTISAWTEDAEAIIEAHAAPGPLVLVGSSMGAWIALRLAMATRFRHAVRGLVLLAPAPDFTSRLVEPRLTAEQHHALREKGRFTEPSPYGEGMVYTRRLIEDGRDAAVMDRPIELGGVAVRVIQGMEDREVPYAHAIDLVTLLPGENVTLTLVRGGDHRLSRPADLELLEAALSALLREVASPA